MPLFGGISGKIAKPISTLRPWKDGNSGKSPKGKAKVERPFQGPKGQGAYNTVSSFPAKSNSFWLVPVALLPLLPLPLPISREAEVGTGTRIQMLKQ